MRAHLVRTGIEPKDVEEAIAILVDQGYLDDDRFVRLFVEDKRELAGWGSDRIRQALLARGIAADLIDDRLAKQGSEGELERALSLLRRRFPSLDGDRRERERALGVLIRKGYDTDLALEAIAAARGADPRDVSAESSR